MRDRSFGRILSLLGLMAALSALLWTRDLGQFGVAALVFLLFLGDELRRSGASIWRVSALLLPLSCLGAGALALIYRHSLPTMLADGRAVSHARDLFELCYQNYYGDLTLFGQPAACWLFFAISFFGAAPLLAVASLARRAPQRLLLSVPTLIFAAYVILPIGAGLLPQAFLKNADALAWLAVALMFALTLQLRRRQELADLMFVGLLARAICALMAAVSSTSTGLYAALLIVVSHGVLATLLGVLFAVPSERRGRRYSLVLRLSCLLALDLPGTLGFDARSMFVLGAWPSFRAATFVAVLVLLPFPVTALRKLLESPPPAHSKQDIEAKTLGLVIGFGAVALALGIWPQPLFFAAQTWVSAFLAHTSGFLGAAAVAIR